MTCITASQSPNQTIRREEAKKLQRKPTHLALINAPVAPLWRHPNPLMRAAIAEPRNLPLKATTMTQITQVQIMPELRRVKSVRRPEVALFRQIGRVFRQVASTVSPSGEQESRREKSEGTHK